MADRADNDSEGPVMRNGPIQQVDNLATKAVDQSDKLQQKFKKQDSSKSQKKEPAGGYDATPIPQLPPGYTIKITFHKAENLPFADFGTFSSDPYILAALKTDLPRRHKQDPELRLRTPTIHRNTNPEWNVEWVIANVPSSGFFLKCRLYDEDPSDHDDRLGNAHITVNHIDENYKGFSQQKFAIKKRMASKRAYTFRGCAALLSKRVKMGGDLIVSVENLGRTKDESGGRAYTIAPLPWSQHYSPLIGRLAGTKDTEHDKDGKEVQKYNFQSIQMQLPGPVPGDLYHRYVEFKPFVAGMFQGKSIRGRLLNRALHHQHARIYNYDKSTKYGGFREPGLDLTKKFLEFVRYDQGGRIFTYVLTLDAQLRFTETGKEFGIDLLSKHTMHSDVSIYIAFSGEFFIRRLKRPHMLKHDSGPDPFEHAYPPAPDPGAEMEEEEKEEKDSNGCRIRPSSKKSDKSKTNGQTVPKEESSSTRSTSSREAQPQPPSEPSKDPSHYELIIDNDSGTYRPNAEKLSVLRKYLISALPGLKVVTLDCQADEEKMKKLKGEQRERKKSAGKQITYLQNSSMSSISSSDEEELSARANGQAHRESRHKREMHKYLGHGRDDHHYPDDEQDTAQNDVAVGNPSVTHDTPARDLNEKTDLNDTVPQRGDETAHVTNHDPIQEK
ncbi:hypothetical protein LTR84_003315 [Exophiala bonariae]|uniref:C2 domain-containing protein n=1 Tax=Exophiala bonariae TaxID=1690606 RepID=A0AAV9N9F1_9EURO|nr:hypothetical protein LTR84_003315 [Exophiala bonariae]